MPDRALLDDPPRLVRTAPAFAARSDAAVRLAAPSLLWLGLLLVTYWWVVGGGVQALLGWDTALMSLGRWSGLVASFLLLAQVLLMARVPVLERAYGQGRLARIHRVVGFTSFTLMVAHIVLITWGYAAGDLLAIPATFWNLTVVYPGMLLAVAGALCLVGVAVTSIRWARRRLRYESWHLLHLYGYLGAGLVLPHQLWSGQEFLASTAATWFWWTAWAVTALAVVCFRVALPVWRNLRHRLRVAGVVPEGDGIWSVHLTGHRLDRLPVEPGQFFSWRFLTGPGWSRAHPYSLSAAPDGTGLRITVKDAGDGSSAVAALRPGTRALVEGPYGRLSPRPRTRRRIALIGAGIGVTPLRSLAEGLDYAPGDAVLLQRYTHSPLFAHELAELGRRRGLQVIHLPGRRRQRDSWVGDGAGTVDDLGCLLSWVPDVAERDVYVCGPPAWVDHVRRTAEAAGVPEERFHVESFGW